MIIPMFLTISDYLQVNTIIRIILTVMLGYVALNSIFHYHFSINRIFFLYLFSLFAIGIIFYDQTINRVFYNILLADSTLFLVIGGYFYFKKNFGYALFNNYKKSEYPRIKEVIDNISAEDDILVENICYNNKKPFLLVFKHIDYHKVKAMRKKIDKAYFKMKKPLTMMSYWHMIVFFIILVIIWRF